MTVGSYEKCKRYIDSHSPGTETPVKRKKVYPCISISRETGAGAQAVCKELIKILDSKSKQNENQWTFFDRQLIEIILEDHHLPKQISKYYQKIETLKRPFPSNSYYQSPFLRQLIWSIVGKLIDVEYGRYQQSYRNRNKQCRHAQGLGLNVVSTQYH